MSMPEAIISNKKINHSINSYEIDQDLRMKMPDHRDNVVIKRTPSVEICEDVPHSEVQSPIQKCSLLQWDNPDKNLRMKEINPEKLRSTSDGYEAKFGMYASGESDTQSYVFTEEDYSELTYESNQPQFQNERSRVEKQKYRVRSNSLSDEKFDLYSATESLRLYSDKLKAEKKQAKKDERAATLLRLGRDPSSIQRYEELYNMGKDRLIIEKENSKLLPEKSEIRSNPQSSSPQVVMNRLYGRSKIMQNLGRDRREKITRTRALSNTRSPITTNMSPSPRRFSTSLVTKRSPSPSPPKPDLVISRLYGRAISMSERGKERREEINTMRAQSNPRHRPKNKVSTPSSRHSRSSSSKHSRSSSSSKSNNYNLTSTTKSSSNPREGPYRLNIPYNEKQPCGRECMEEGYEKRTPGIE